MKKLPMLFTISLTVLLGFAISASATDSSIPEWMKNNAKW